MENHPPQEVPAWLSNTEVPTRKIEDWSRDELISAVRSLMTVNAAALEIVSYVQREPDWDEEEMMNRITFLAGAHSLTPPLPGE